MAYSPPTPPRDLPDDLVRSLEDLPNERLREAARYAEELVEHRNREQRLDDQDENETVAPDDASGDASDVVADDVPDDVPGKATLTIKEINDNRYYYWQWREGDAIKSRYEGPVDSNE